MSTQEKVKKFSECKVSKILAFHFSTFSSIQITIMNRRVFKISFMIKYWEFQTLCTKGKHLEQKIFAQSKVQVIYISLLKVKTSSEMLSLYKKDFAWKILFAKLNDRNSSCSKAILKKEQTFCSPSDWWYSTFSAFHMEYNTLLTTLLCYSSST